MPGLGPIARTPKWSAQRAQRWLEARDPLGMHFGLDRMHSLLSALGEPQLGWRSIHVVGTNGKSSTVRMTAAILQRHGLRTAAYLSPHLQGFAERIEIAEQPLDDDCFAATVQRVAEATERLDALRPAGDHITQFEVLTAAAYVAFASHHVDVAVVEAGLGGRLDATNVLQSDVQVLTSIALEHTALLGDTPLEIAAEKLAIVRNAATLVLGTRLDTDVVRLAERVAAQRGARLIHADAAQASHDSFPQRNLATAVAAAKAFHGPLDDHAIKRAALSVRTPGRLEVVGKRPTTILDAAHNPAGVEALIEALPAVINGRAVSGAVVALVSILADKDAEAMMSALLDYSDRVVITTNSNPRAINAHDLARTARRLGARDVTIESRPRRALDAARLLAGHNGVVVATGSIYLVGDLTRPDRRAQHRRACDHRVGIESHHTN